MLRFDRRVCVRSDLIVECACAQLRFDRRVCVRTDLIVECAYAQI